MPMDSNNPMGLLRVKVVALSVTDEKRAHLFYRDTLGLAPAFEGNIHVGYFIGDVILMLKPGWMKPTDQPNYRITIAANDAHKTEIALREKDVVISDPVKQYDDFWVGGFIDSEGNKLYFCSPVTG